jgi:lipopolysaccharide cholinephosphotransferase
MSDIKEVQFHLLEGMKYIHEICEDNNINYFLIAGSALGAERHSGFIPWDDDVDVGLIRDDYNRLLEVLKNSKHDKYFLQDNQTESNYFLGYGKLRINDTIYKEKYYKHVDIHQGISIDIFPLDNVGESTFSSKIKYSFIKIIKVLILVKYYNFTKRGVLYAVFFCPLMFLSKRSLLKMTKRLLKSHNNIKNPFYLMNFFGRYNFDKELINVKGFGIPKLNKFEDISLYVPGNNKNYLTNLYGDYMKLPPMHLRETHSPVEIKL